MHKSWRTLIEVLFSEIAAKEYRFISNTVITALRAVFNFDTIITCGSTSILFYTSNRRKTLTLIRVVGL